MTDSISRHSQGGDIHLELARQNDAGLAVDPDLLRRVRAQYRMRIRGRLQHDAEARALAAESEPASAAEERMIELLSDLMTEGTEHVFRESVRYILEELDALRKLEASQYIVDPETGSLVGPVSDKTVFLPKTEDPEPGRPKRAPIPVVHPAITSALALSAAEENRVRRARELAKDPVRGNAYRHITEPERMVELAKERLRDAGVTVSEEPLSSSPEPLDFGAEAIEADEQAVNPMHHRLSSYSAILATLVFRRCGPGGMCWIGPVVRMTSTTRRWYRVMATATEVKALC